MKKFTIINTGTFHQGNTVKRFFAYTLVTLLFICSFFSNATGQAGNIDQIRNGPATDPPKNFYKNFPNPTWVNGNAGSSNAHYVEGMSIGYRSLLTGLTVGKTYTYVISYDTKHSDAMAIDYLTHYQRLQPHGPFGHTAEVINPLIFESGSKEYLMGVVSGPSTRAVPLPDPEPNGYWNNSTNVSGHGGIDDGTPVDDQPKNSFNNLNSNANEPNDNVMTIYNGSLLALTYQSQASLVTGNQDAETFVRIQFTAAKDSVLLAWGGHIGSRLDWGFVNGKPRSAGGISGSPYHMRQKELYVFNDFANHPNDSTTLSVGNQDRSLSAAAVVPPPECPTVPSQTVCSGGSFSAFTIASPQAGAIYTWSFATNTANAAFSGGGATATGSSVSIVAGSGGFTAGGSFSFNITASLNSIEQVCTGVASGSIVKVVATASASPTSIDITSLAHNTSLTGGIDASSTDATEANYNYVWTIVTGGTAAGLTNASQKVATYTAALADAGSTITFKVTATQKSAPFCSDDETVQVTVSSVGACDVSAQAAVCQATVTTHTGSPNPKPTNATYTWSLGGYGGSGSTTATLVGGNSGTASQQVTANSSYRITLSQVYLNTALNTSCFEDVTVVATPSVATTYNPPTCYEKQFTVDVTSPTIGYIYSIDQPDNNLTFNSITPTAQSPTVHFTGLTNGDGFIVTVNTGGPGCTNTSTCVNPNAARLATNTENTAANKTTKPADIYNIKLVSPTKVNAVPNPFTDKIRFNLVSTISGMGSLELFNMLGQKVGVVYQGYIQAGQELTKEYLVSKEQRSTLIYVFKVGDQRITGKLIGLK